MEQKIQYDGIIFTGKMASGKTYFSNLLISKIKEKDPDAVIYKVSIAQKIKDIATDVFGMKEKDRRLLQQLGSKLRDIDKDVWIKYLSNNIESNKKFPFVVDDVRFSNEIAYLDNIKKPNGENTMLYIVRLVTSEKDRIKKYKEIYGREPTFEELNDATESEIDKLPYTCAITNKYNPVDADVVVSKIINDLYQS